MVRIRYIPMLSSDASVGIALALLLGLAAFVFWPATHGPFLFDDFANLQNLQALEQGIDLPALGRYLHNFVGNPGRPLGALSFLIDDNAWPTSPGQFKQTNLLLHLLVGVLVFVLARQLSGLCARNPATAGWVALLATSIWLLHPMQLASTMLVVQRMNILATAFSLAGLSCYVALATRQRFTLAVLSLWASAALAFLCKENGVLVFAYAMVLNHTVLAPLLERIPPRGTRFLKLAAWLPLLVVAIAMAFQSSTLMASYQLRDYTLVERLMTESRVVLEYLARIVVPRLGGQGLYHDDYPISTGLLSPVTTLPAIVFWATAVALALAGRRRFYWASFGTLWFVSGHLLESTVLPLELYFEHRNYLPMVGPILALVALAFDAPPKARKIVGVGLGLWLSLALWSTALNARAWGSELQLARVWHVENLGSARATQLLARVYESQGQTRLARQTLVGALRSNPAQTELLFQLALLDCIHHRLRRDDVDRLARVAARVRPRQSIDAAMQRLRRAAQEDACGGTLPPDRWHEVATALLDNPQYGRVGSLAGSIHFQMARSAEKERNLDVAMREYDAAFRYLRDPRIPQRQAVLLLSAGLSDDALRYLRISDEVHAPWPKRAFFDIEGENARIRVLVLDAGSSPRPVED